MSQQVTLGKPPNPGLSPWDLLSTVIFENASMVLGASWLKPGHIVIVP